MKQSDVTLVIPGYNNLRHLKNCYASIKKHAKDIKLILLDDGSTDGTIDWLYSLKDPNITSIYRSEDRIGHTILYDKGIDLAETEIVGIFHCDMIMGPNYIENVLKHLSKKVVVAGTRIEPPLHPPGNEKIIQNFGIDFDDLNIPAFEEFCIRQEEINKDETSRGMFAPWIIYKEDFLSVGGHDHIFAPFPYEDSDIFERWILSGYKLIQSRDAFVYHLTCRGHRYTEQIGKDDDYFKNASQRAAREYLRKWGSWIKNDEFQHPIIKPKYNIGFIVKNCTLQAMAFLEPMCTNIYVEDQSIINDYFKYEQPNTNFNLHERIALISAEKNNDILIEFDFKKLTQDHTSIVQQFPEIIKDSGRIGHLELDEFKLTITSMKTYESDMIQPMKKYI